MQRLHPEQFPIPVDRITKLLRVLVVGGAVIAASCASVPKSGSDATAQGEGDAQGEGKAQGKGEEKGKTGEQGTGTRTGKGTSQSGSSESGGSDPGGVRGW